MEENRFFKHLWRFNALVISVVGVLAVISLLFVVYQLFKETTRERHASNVVNIEQTNQVKESWRLGHMTKLKHQDVLVIPLHSDQNFDQSYFSKSTNSTRNLLFIDNNTNAKHWLFEHTRVC